MTGHSLGVEEAALVSFSEAECIRRPRNSNKAAVKAITSDKNETYMRPAEEVDTMQEPSNWDGD
jgi:hypothetical protein